MTQHLAYLVLGLGAGAALAMLGVGLVLTYRVSGAVNFAHGAIGMYLAYTFYEFRETGDVVLPIVGLPDRIHLLDRPTVASALVVLVVYSAILGWILYQLIFRHLRSAPALANTVASVGLFLYLWSMVVLRFPTRPTARKILPSESIDFFGHPVFRDRLFTAAIAVVIVTMTWAVYRFTRFGLATTAISDSPKGAVLTGINANVVGAVNWMAATVLSGVAVTLIAPVNQLDPLQLSLLVVPALAAFLLGGGRSIIWVGVAGFAIGMLQSEIVNLQAEWPAVSGLGLQQGLPFVLILAALIFRGDSLPQRGESTDSGLPDSPEPKRVGMWAAIALAAGFAVAVFGSSGWRAGVITTSIATLIYLSIVVLTGFVGQISLAPYAFAGVAAFSLPILDRWGVPFPLAPLLAAGVAMALGVLVGIPSVRVRGMQLAIATLGAAVAVEQILFRWDWFVDPAGTEVPEPTLWGLDLGISAPGDEYPRAAFVIFCAAVAVAATVAVANLRRSETGAQWLAVRSNERTAASVGIDVVRTKLIAFAVSAYLAGLCGVLLAYEFQTISVDSFTVFASLAALALTYMAGITSVSGAVLAGLLTPLGVLTVATGGDGTTISPYSYVVNGALLILVAVVYPSGITGAVRHGWNRFRDRRIQREALST